jgi:beta-propeller repeat-containing protein
MWHSARIQSRTTFTSLVFLANLAAPAIAATAAHVSESYGKLPLQFEENRGQTDMAVRFLSHGAGYSLYLTAGEAVLVLSKPEHNVALRMSLVGAAREPQLSGLDKLPGKANYFIGKDPAKWRKNVPTYAKVRYREVYPGIDLVYYGNQRALEYDFVVAPGADPKKIVLDFKGADKLEIDAGGDLVLHASGGDIRQHRPVIYQSIEGIRRDVGGGYVRKGANRVAFKVAAYDTSRPLIVDPVLSYSTYLGGSGGDQGAGIAVDSDGNAYITGRTTSADFPTTLGAFQSVASPAGANAYVTKLNPTGSALVYCTYLGGSGDDKGAAIAVDASGNAYVTGTTRSTDFPTTAGAFQPTLAGGSSNAFVTKIASTGSALVYSTYLGGSGASGDGASGIAVDGAGNTYVTGATSSNDFPTAAAFQPTFADSGLFGTTNAFVTKLDPTGSSLVYSTYLGGSSARGGNAGAAIAVDAAGNAYATGVTQSDNFPTTPGAFQTTTGGGGSPGLPWDAFVTKFDSSGSLVYSTYLGGSGDDQGRGIAVDATGNAYVTGSAGSTNFPTTAGAYQPANGGGSDSFVTKLDPAGAALVYSTYLGKASGAVSSGIAVDSAGNAYVTGMTFMICGRSSCINDYPTTPGAPQPDYGGSGSDGFVTKLDPAGSALVYSTFLGGSGADNGSGIAVDTSGNAYITGGTNSPNFPTTATAFQPILRGTGGASNAFVAKIVDAPPSPPPAPTNTTRSEESAATQIGFWTGYGAETGTFSGGGIVASNVIASTAMFSFTGTAVSWIGVKCNVCGIAAVSIDGGAPTTVNTAGPNAPGSLTSEPVFSASGLAAASHMITITVTGTSSSTGTYVAVDAFDVTAGSATSPILPSVALPPPPVTLPPLPPILGL